MNRVLELHTWVGRTGMRLLYLQILWMAWTLRGAIVLGVFPATAALYAVLRTDAVDRARGIELGSRVRSVRVEFRAAWHAEFRSSNLLGLLLTLAWTVLLVERRIVAEVDLGDLAPVLAGLLSVLGVVLFVVSTQAWVLAAHFDESALATILRGATLLAARPVLSLTTGAGCATLMLMCYVVPGLLPVLGLAGPAMVSTHLLWRAGILRLPAGSAREPAGDSRHSPLPGPFPPGHRPMINPTGSDYD